MDDGSETVVGFPAYRSPPPAPPTDPVGAWTLDSLARQDRRALESAELEAHELARALAAQAVALAPDAEPREYAERLVTLERTVWPEAPLDGFLLESSLGAYLVARVAMQWAPPTSVHLREVPLAAEGLLMALRDQGLDARVATTLVGDWAGVPEGFVPEASGLDANRLAGLAEGGLTRAERHRALAQLAHSPRCTARFVAVSQALAHVRTVLPSLPPTRLELGHGYVPAAAALMLGRPDRTLDLLGYRPDQPALLALAELARAELSLARGEPILAEDDPSLVLPPAEPARPSLVPRGTSMPALPAEDDDVLEVVEENIHSASTGAMSLLPTSDLVSPGAGPRVPGWASFDEGVVFDAPFLAHWRSARRAHASVAARLPRVLGLVRAPGSPTRPPVALPPEPRVLIELIQREGLAADEASSNANTDRIDLGLFHAMQEGRSAAMASPEPQCAAVRAVLRAISGAIEGFAPTEDAVARAGDLEWALARARALALGAAGDLAGAEAAAARLGGPLPLELRWVEARKRRYEGRAAPAAPISEVRRVALPLVRDLAEAFVGSVSGALG